jgi:glycerophosphoryl diester phosphodiesterase
MTLLWCLEKLVDGYFSIIPRRKPALKHLSIVAHRGAHDARLQENTLPSFEQALALGCQGLELDIHASADGVLMVNHDPTLKRLWGHEGLIGSLSFQDLRDRLPALPTLAEVVARFGKRMHLFIEVKVPFSAYAALEATLHSLAPGEDYHLLCLDETVLSQLTMFPKASLLLVASHHNVNKFCDISLEEFYGGVLGHYLLLTNRHVKKLREANQLVGVGFVDSKFSLYRELNRGVHLLFTNKAKKIMSLV